MAPAAATTTTVASTASTSASATACAGAVTNMPLPLKPWTLPAYPSWHYLHPFSPPAPLLPDQYSQAQKDVLFIPYHPLPPPSHSPPCPPKQSLSPASLTAGSVVTCTEGFPLRGLLSIPCPYRSQLLQAPCTPFRPLSSRHCWVSVLSNQEGAPYPCLPLPLTPTPPFRPCPQLPLPPGQWSLAQRGVLFTTYPYRSPLLQIALPSSPAPAPSFSHRRVRRDILFITYTYRPPPQPLLAPSFSHRWISGHSHQKGAPCRKVGRQAQPLLYNRRLPRQAQAT